MRGVRELWIRPQPVQSVERLHLVVGYLVLFCPLQHQHELLVIKKQPLKRTYRKPPWESVTELCKPSILPLPLRCHCAEDSHFA